jgi:hypothetical protein
MFGKLFGLGRKNRHAPYRKMPGRPGSFRPRLEELEVRCTPSVSIYLQGTSSGFDLYAVCSGGPDTVTVDHSGSFTSINGVSYSDVNFSSIYITGAAGGLTTNIRATVKPVHVEAHHHLDAVNIGDATNHVQGIQASLYLTNPPDYDVVNVNNQGDSAARTATINTVTIGGSVYERITGLGMGGEIDCKVADTSNVNLQTGTGGTIVNVLATAALPGGSTTLFGHGSDTVNVGNLGSVQNIAGSLTIENPPNYSTVNVFDQNDNTNHTVTLDNFTSGGVYGRIQGLAPAAISYRCADARDVNIHTSFGSATVVVNVLSTRPILGNLTLFGHSSDTTVNIGNAGSVQDIQGNLTIQNPPYYTTVNVDDSADATGQFVLLNNVTIGGTPYGEISGLAPANIFYKLQDTASVTIGGGTGGNIFQIEAVTAAVPITINGGSGTNIFRVSPLAQLLDNIQGTLTLNGSGSDILEFFDQNHNSASPETYTFDSIPSNLTLATDPSFNCNFTGMASVYLETNLDPSNVINDASMSVLVDVPAP